MDRDTIFVRVDPSPGADGTEIRLDLRSRFPYLFARVLRGMAVSRNGETLNPSSSQKFGQNFDFLSKFTQFCIQKESKNGVFYSMAPLPLS